MATTISFGKSVVLDFLGVGLGEVVRLVRGDYLISVGTWRGVEIEVIGWRIHA